MIPSERILDVTYGKSAIDGVSGLNPGPQEQTKPSETPAAPTIPDNDAEIASINTNPLRGELADIQSALRQDSGSTSRLQRYRQFLADLVEKREKLSEQVKELARLKDKKAQQQALLEKIDTLKKQINDLANSAHLDVNKISTAAGQDMTISVGDGVVIDIPAKDPGVNLTDVELSEGSDTVLENIKRTIQEIVDNDGFLLGVEKKLDAFTTMMAFELLDVLIVEENITEKNLTLELGKFSLVRVLQDMHNALRGQANVSPDAAASLLIDTNQNAA